VLAAKAAKDTKHLGVVSDGPIFLTDRVDKSMRLAERVDIIKH
jgi:hypothetical protein